MDNGSNSRVTLVAVLALAQAVLAVLRSLHWFEIGSDLMGQGILLLPAIAAFSYARGVLVTVIAILYALFACSEFAGRMWGRPYGIVAAVLNLILVVTAILGGEAFLRVLLWAIVPIVVLWHAFSPSHPRPAHARAA